MNEIDQAFADAGLRDAPTRVPNVGDPSLENDSGIEWIYPVAIMGGLALAVPVWCLVEKWCCKPLRKKCGVKPQNPLGCTTGPDEIISVRLPERSLLEVAEVVELNSRAVSFRESQYESIIRESLKNMAMD